nr:MAG TPA: hypothetical protein [Caudoviricetes sp.]
MLNKGILLNHLVYSPGLLNYRYAARTAFISDGKEFIALLIVLVVTFYPGLSINPIDYI